MSTGKQPATENGHIYKKKYINKYTYGTASIVEPKLFVSAPAPTFKKFRSRLRL